MGHRLSSSAVIPIRASHILEITLIRENHADYMLSPRAKKINVLKWMYCVQDSPDQCPMPINTDQNSGIDPKYLSIKIYGDQWRSFFIGIGIKKDRH